MILNEDMAIRTVDEGDGRYFHAGDLARMFLTVSRNPNLTMVDASRLRKISDLINKLAAKEI